MSWYHGTNAELVVGERLVPGDSIGISNFPDLENGWGVWITPNRTLASKYGENVYEVTPIGELTDWCDENGWERDDLNDEFVCDSAQIVSEVTP